MGTERYGEKQEPEFDDEERREGREGSSSTKEIPPTLDEL
jgi:hypothetical protein